VDFAVFRSHDAGVHTRPAKTDNVRLFTPRDQPASTDGERLAARHGDVDAGGAAGQDQAGEGPDAPGPEGGA